MTIHICYSIFLPIIKIKFIKRIEVGKQGYTVFFGMCADGRLRH